MFCVNCGVRLTDGKPFCPNCGARADAQQPYQQQQQPYQQQQQQPYQPVIPRPAPFPGDAPQTAPKPDEAYLRYSGSAAAAAAMSSPARPAPYAPDGGAQPNTSGAYDLYQTSAPARPTPFPGDAPIPAQPERRS